MKEVLQDARKRRKEQAENEPRKRKWKETRAQRNSNPFTIRQNRKKKTDGQTDRQTTLVVSNNVILRRNIVGCFCFKLLEKNAANKYIFRATKLSMKMCLFMQKFFILNYSSISISECVFRLQTFVDFMVKQITQQVGNMIIQCNISNRNYVEIYSFVTTNTVRPLNAGYKGNKICL